MEDSQVLKQKLMLDVTAPELLEKEQGLSVLRWSKAFSGGWGRKYGFKKWKNGRRVHRGS